ncbi:PIG-L deacetylase family protein [Dyadobacter arcticus]|uniref:LmbE family N-acetylglucosaminyl deacetylase n=1 Tax=Dyadobacter arcticus TaxID=1078754 RepID=A0ABX0UNI2_9BACT|nr:PIG-L deacetylase family protein [Dyadobacter arcticus]NIJ54487.1 LmbE family N-acetylglucosaminyl deacetylase [Dyadobacter arcticus]
MDSQPVVDFEKKMADVPTVPASSFGDSMVIAPHADDETLGCGGTAALLLREGFTVQFVFVSDGTLSHPNSKKYPAPRLRVLRELEAIHAVEILGGKKENVDFLSLPDRNVPHADSLYFESVVRLMMACIRQHQPQTIFIPWQNDPHPDHRASFQILTEAVLRLDVKPRILQYPIWLWEMGNVRDIELISKMQICGVDIRNVLEIKRKALDAHQSQITDLIDDDPDGFRLSEEMIAHFSNAREIFFENERTIFDG